MSLERKKAEDRLPFQETEGTSCEISRRWACPERAFLLVLIEATGQRLWLGTSCLAALEKHKIRYEKLDQWRRRFVG